MNNLSKIIIGLASLGVVGFGAGYLALTSGILDLSLEELEARYQTPDSRWIDIDGIRVHYYDQVPADDPDAPVIVLSHASFMNLHSWDGLAEALLANGYRVIRMDFLNVGLTSYDSRGINSMERNVQILTELPERLGVSRYHLIGTSSGGQISFMHAGRYPARVERFILINSGGMPRTAQSNPNRPRHGPIKGFITRYYRSRGYWTGELERNIPTLRPLPPALVDLVYDMNRRAGGRPHALQYLRNFKTGDTPSLLAAVQAPTMILQGMSNATLLHTEAELQSYWMTGAPTLIRKYEDFGHYPYLERPQTVAQDVLAFLGRQYDDQLHQTVRIPYGSSETDAPGAAPIAAIDLQEL